MQTSGVKEKIFKLGCDTRGRSLDVAKVLQSLSLEGKMLLDTGCGENGLAEYANPANVISTDINIFRERIGDPKFLCSSITALPFADDFFPVVATVDVLEHLPVEIRNSGVGEMVRVAREAVLMAFPCGERARQTDESFHANLNKDNKIAPEWLEEHLQNPYPSAEDIIIVVEEAATKYNKKIESVKLFYSEPIKITQALRWTAAKSKFLYIAANSLFGMLLPIISQPQKNNSYRTIILVQFENA